MIGFKKRCQKDSAGARKKTKVGGRKFPLNGLDRDERGGRGRKASSRPVLGRLQHCREGGQRRKICFGLTGEQNIQVGEKSVVRRYLRGVAGQAVR